MPVESGVKRLREQEFDWAVEQKRVQILLDTTVSSAANATTESGAKRSRMGRRVKGTGRDAEFTERSRGGSQRSPEQITI